MIGEIATFLLGDVWRRSTNTARRFLEDKLIRVLHFAGIINRFDIIDTVLTRLDRNRFEVFALTGSPPRQVGAYPLGTDYPTRCLNFEFTRSNYLRMFRSLVEEVKRVRPHILQVHHYDANLVASAVVRVLGLRSYVIGRHYSDHIYFLTHGLKQKLFLEGENFSNRTADKIAVPSLEVAQLLIQKQGVPKEKVAVIPFGLDFDKYRTSSADAPQRLRREFHLQNKYFILACCRLSPEKGLDYLIRAFVRVRTQNQDARLVFVGNGSFELELRSLSHSLGLDDAVTFVGWRDDALDWIAAADLVVQPSFAESFCQVLFEALGFAKPVIMTPVGAAPEVIGDNERGRIIPKGDSAAIASAICELMQDRQLGNELGRLGQSFIYQNMGADRTARLYEQLYTQLANTVG